MQQNPLVLALASVGFAAAMSAPSLEQSSAEEPAFIVAQAAPAPPEAAPARSNIGDFFRDFTTEWVRNDPDLATRTRYFAGEEQDRLERQFDATD
jgi:hypothetical protein